MSPSNLSLSLPSARLLFSRRFRSTNERVLVVSRRDSRVTVRQRGVEVARIGFADLYFC